MSQEQWSAVDQYLNEHFTPSDPILEATLAAVEAAGMPNQSVAPNQGKMLAILAQTIGAASILEIGTLGGYSTIWLARSLAPGGRLITLEYNPRHAEVARANLERAGLAERVEVRVGPAIESLPRLADELDARQRGPFDFVFIDADKQNNAAYFEWALRLTRRGGLIVVDNVIRDGAVIDAGSENPNIQGVRRFFERAAAEPRVMMTAIQTVGSKGYDGFALALVL
jgi:predicted O-methyltransferase YrrM